MLTSIAILYCICWATGSQCSSRYCSIETVLLIFPFLQTSITSQILQSTYGGQYNVEINSSVPYGVTKLLHLGRPETSHDNEATAADAVHTVMDLNCIINDAEYWMLTNRSVHTLIYQTCCFIIIQVALLSQRGRTMLRVCQ